MVLFEGTVKDHNDLSSVEKKNCTHTFFEAQVGNFADWGAPALHKKIQLIQEELLLGVWKPISIPLHLYTAHHILL